MLGVAKEEHPSRASEQVGPRELMRTFPGIYARLPLIVSFVNIFELLFVLQ